MFLYKSFIFSQIDSKSGRSITYGQFDSEVEQFAASLLKVGLLSTDHIIFYSDNDHEYTVAWFAASYLGLPMNSMKPAVGPYEFGIQAHETGGTVLLFGPSKLSVIKRVFTNEQYREKVKQIRLIVQFDSATLDPFIVELVSSSADVEEAKTFADVAKLGDGQKLTRMPHFPVANLKKDPFSIFYTSGTSGKAKGVIHSHSTFLAKLINFTLPEKHDGQKIVIPFPLGHISGSLFLTSALDRGMTVLFTGVLSTDQIVTLIARYRVQQYIFTSNAAPHLACGDFTENPDLSCLKVFRYGGSKTSAHLLEAIRKRYDAEMYEMYGSTEFLGHVSNFRNPSAAKENFKVGSVGDLQPNCQMKVTDLNDPGRNLPPNEEGEICFRGPPCFTEYLKNKEETKAAKDADGWYRTGDVGYYDENGCLYITDRIKELIKYKMYSVFPAFIEEYITQLPEVEAVCVVGVQHTTDGQLPRAYVLLKAGRSLTEETLKLTVKGKVQH